MRSALICTMFFALAIAVSAAEPPAAADPYRDALIAAVHHFAEGGQATHLQAVLDKHPDLLEARRGPQGGKPTYGDGFTPLQTAARAGRGAVALALLGRRANVNAVDAYGHAPLHLAAWGGHLDIVKALVKAGAKVDAKTEDVPGGVAPGGPAESPPIKTDPIPAQTALQLAEGRNHADVVAFLKTVK